MGAAEKMVLWDSWLRGESPKATWRAFGKPSSLFIASWPPVLRRPVATTSKSGQTRAQLECPLSAISGHSLGQLARPLSARSGRRRQVCAGSVANLCPPTIGDATMTMLICVAYQMPPSVRSPSPNLVGQLGHQTQLRPLFVFGQHIAFLGRGETTLR